MLFIAGKVLQTGRRENEVMIPNVDQSWYINYHYRMKITIDRVGRVVIPKELRRRYHLQPGTELEIAGDARGIRIAPARTMPSLVSKDGILVHHGEDGDLQRQDLDVGAFIVSQRAQRDAFMVAQDPE